MEKSCIASRSLLLMKILRTNFLAFALVLGVLLNVDLLDGADHASLSGFSPPPPQQKLKPKLSSLFCKYLEFHGLHLQINLISGSNVCFYPLISLHQF